MTSPSYPAPIRYDGLDLVRAGAMLLGVAYHASWAYVPNIAPYYVVGDSQSHAFFAIFTSVVHAFRMQLFFALSGFFAHLVLEKRGDNFLRDRFWRLMGPFLVALPLVIACDFVTRMWARPGLVSIRAAPSHLWFLEYLFLMCLIAWKSRSIWPSLPVLRFPLISLGLLSALTGTMLVLNPKMSPDASLVPELSTFVFYFLFFIFGWFIYAQKDSILHLSQWSIPFLNFGIALSLWVFKDNTQYTPTGHFAEGFIASAFTFSILGFAFKLLGFKAPILSFIVQSSYWVYLSHYPLVVALHVAFTSLSLTVFQKYFAVLFLTLVACFASALLVRKTPFALVLGFKPN